MKRILSFDAYDASAYDVLDALYPFRSLPGVKSVEVLTAVEGSPRYCIVIDVEDDKDAALMARADEFTNQYTGYYSNLTMRAFRKVG